MFAQLISPGLGALITPMAGCQSGPNHVGHCRGGGIPKGYGVCYTGLDPESGRCIGGAVLAGT